MKIWGGFKYVTENSINQYFLYFTESIYVVAVNLFILISAYFLSATPKRKFVKVIELILQVSIFRLVFYLGGSVIGMVKFTVRDAFVYLLPANYFVILYVTLYIISPYINILIGKISKEDLEKLIIKLFILFSIWTSIVDVLESVLESNLSQLSTIGMYGSQNGYTIVNFILIYIIASYVRMYNPRPKKRNLMFGICILIFIIYSISITELKLGILSRTAWNYNNPLLVILACFLILLFT